MDGKVHEYSTGAIRVLYDVKRCIHAAECVRRLPGVFDPNRRPWVDPSAASPDALAQVIVECPTGALQFERLDGGAGELVGETTEAVVARDGPLYLRGEVRLFGSDGSPLLRDTRVALCRCGASSNKPFCDGVHATIGFKAE